MQTKTNARPREAVITVKYHYTGPGRRPKLRTDISRSVLAAVIRRLERHGALVVDDIQILDK